MIRTRPVTFAGGGWGLLSRGRRRCPVRAKKKAIRDAPGHNETRTRERALWSDKKVKRQRDVSRTRRLLNASRTNLPRRVRGAINIRRIRGTQTTRSSRSPKDRHVCPCCAVDAKCRDNLLGGKKFYRWLYYGLSTIIDLTDCICKGQW